MSEAIVDEPIPCLEGWKIRVTHPSKGICSVKVTCRLTRDVGTFKEGTYRTPSSSLGMVEDVLEGSLSLLTEAETLCLSILPHGMSTDRAAAALRDPFWQSVIDRVKAHYVMSQ